MAGSRRAALAAVTSKKFAWWISSGNKHGVEATVSAIEYDPVRTARLALLEYKDGEKTLHHRSDRHARWAAKLMSGPTAAAGTGQLPAAASRFRWASPIHNIELTPGRGGQMVRTAGGAATLMSRDEGYAQIRLPSGEIRRINENCYATIGQVGNTEHENVVLGKAGRSRHRGIRPINRGVARNPVDHPNGGGAGKSKSGGGWQQLTSPWGLLAKGYRDPPQEEIFQPVYRGPARWPADEEQVSRLWDAQLKKVRSLISICWTKSRRRRRRKSKAPIKTWSRRSMITPDFVGPDLQRA